MIDAALGLFLLVAPTAKEPAGEVMVDAASRDGPPEASRKIHGHARVDVAFGAALEDPIASITPAVELDFHQIAPVYVGIAIPFRLRLFDRNPDDPGVLRRQDWDEAGDYFAVINRAQYADDYAVGQAGYGSVDLRAGSLGRVDIGHSSIVRGYHNGLDIDRRRLGVDLRAQLGRSMLEYPATLDFEVFLGDVTGFQVLGTRVAGRWAGAGLGLSAFGDPTAPRTIARDAGDAAAFARGRGGRLDTTGRRGVAALGFDVSYLATDEYRFEVEPYLDVVIMPFLGQGMHLGVSGEVALGRRRRVHLGALAELTVGSRGYDPAYFDVFYLYERWQTPFVRRPGDRPADLGDEALPKYEFVQQADLGGAGGGGALRFAHDDGAYAEVRYHARPGPRGHTFQARTGVDVRPVDLSLLLAHRGRHGFEPKAAGSVATVDLRVAVLRYLDVIATAAWLFAIRPDPSGATAAAGETGLVTGGGLWLFGVAGRVPW